MTTGCDGLSHHPRIVGEAQDRRRAGDALLGARGAAAVCRKRSNPGATGRSTRRESTTAALRRTAWEEETINNPSTVLRARSMSAALSAGGAGIVLQQPGDGFRIRQFGRAIDQLLGIARHFPSQLAHLQAEIFAFERGGPVLPVSLPRRDHR